MMASASLDVTISSSMVSSGTSVKAAWAPPGGGRSVERDTEPPVTKAERRPATMPRCQDCAPAISDCTRSRRRWKTACSEGLSSNVRAASIAACTTDVRPLTSCSE